MPRKPFRRSVHKSEAAKREREAAFVKLFPIEPFHRNEITKNQIDRLREMIDAKGLQGTAELVGVNAMTLLRVCAGFGHQLNTLTRGKFREFLN